MTAAGAGGRAVRRDRPAAPGRPGSASGPRSSSSFRPRSAGGHVFELTGDRPRGRVSGVDRAHLGNTGFSGQPVAVVVAEMLDQARQAAGLVCVTYEAAPPT